MADTHVAQAITEIDLALAAMADRHEGLRDFDALNLSQASTDAVKVELAEFDRRFALLNTARLHLVNLMDDGYPELPPTQVTVEVLTEIQYNARTVLAAVSQFEIDRASALNLSAGPKEVK
jgi:hypothetical protein